MSLRNDTYLHIIHLQRPRPAACLISRSYHLPGKGNLSVNRDSEGDGVGAARVIGRGDYRAGARGYNEPDRAAAKGRECGPIGTLASCAVVNVEIGLAHRATGNNGCPALTRTRATDTRGSKNEQCNQGQQNADFHGGYAPLLSEAIIPDGAAMSRQAEIMHAKRGYQC